MTPKEKEIETEIQEPDYEYDNEQYQMYLESNFYEEFGWV